MSGYLPITVVNVSQQVGPTPSVLQRTGALVSQGGTTLTPGTYSLLTAPSDLTPLLTGALAISTITVTGSGPWVATVTAAAPHGFTISDTLPITLSGVIPTAFNGTKIATVTTTTAFTITFLSASPGSETTPGFYTPEDVNELTSMVTTFFAQGQANSVYVLELGAGNAQDGITALTTFITANPGVFYSYLLPHQWGVSTAFYTFALTYNGTTARTYFHVTTTIAFYNNNPTIFAKTQKACIVTIEAPTVAAGAQSGTASEFSAAAGFYVTLNLAPSPSNQVTQAAFSFLFGVTAYPVVGNKALFTTLSAAGINIVGTGAEGGISNTIWLYGTTLDGNDFNKYWYSVDNVQINLDLNTSNAVINGSNNPQAPLNYNQQGINTIQAVAGNTMQSEIASSLALGALVLTQMTGTAFAQAVALGTFAGQVVVNAVPFSNYVQLQPGNYPLGIYGGMSVAYTVQNGFRQIIYNVTVSNFV